MTASKTNRGDPRWIAIKNVQPTIEDYPLWATSVGDRHRPQLHTEPDRAILPESGFYTHWQRAYVPIPPQPPTPGQIAEAACVDAYRAQSMDFAEAEPSYDWRTGWMAALEWAGQQAALKRVFGGKEGA